MIQTLCSCCNFISSRKYKLLQYSESGFKRTINWNKYIAKTTSQAQNRYLDYLIDPGFQGVNRLFVFCHLKMLMSQKITNKIILQLWKYYNVMIDGKNVFDQPIKNNLKRYDDNRRLNNVFHYWRSKRNRFRFLGRKR